MQLYKKSVIVSLISLLASQGVVGEGYLRPSSKVVPSNPIPKTITQSPVAGAGSGSRYNSADLVSAETIEDNTTAVPDADEDQNDVVAETVNDVAEDSSAGSVDDAEETSSADSTDSTDEADEESNEASGDGTEEDASTDASGEADAGDETEGASKEDSGEDAEENAGEEIADDEAADEAAPDADERREAAKQAFSAAASKYDKSGTAQPVEITDPETEYLSPTKPLAYSSPSYSHPSSVVEPKVVDRVGDADEDLSEPKLAQETVEPEEQSEESEEAIEDEEQSEVEGQGSAGSLAYSQPSPSSGQASGGGSVGYAKPEVTYKRPESIDQANGKGSAEDVEYKRPTESQANGGGSAEEESDDQASGAGSAETDSDGEEKVEYQRPESSEKSTGDADVKDTKESDKEEGLPTDAKTKSYLDTIKGWFTSSS